MIMYEKKTAEDLRKRMEAMEQEVSGQSPDKTAAAQKKAAAYNAAFWETMHTGVPQDALKEGRDGSGGYLVPDT